MHPKTRNRVVALFCIPLMARVPSLGMARCRGHRGRRHPAIRGDASMGACSVADCPCADDGTFWQFRSGDNQRDRSCAGNHVYETTHHHILICQ